MSYLGFASHRLREALARSRWAVVVVLACSSCGRTGLLGWRSNDAAPGSSSSGVAIDAPATALRADGPTADAMPVDTLTPEAPRPEVQSEDTFSPSLHDAAPQCKLVASGPPLPVDFEQQPMCWGLVVLDRGEPGSSRPVHLALHAMGRRSEDEIVLADLHIPSVWPDRLTLDHPSATVGPGAHSCETSALSADGKTLYLAYHGDPLGGESGLYVLPVDVATWKLGNLVGVNHRPWAVPTGMSGGPVLDSTSAWNGQGLGITWSAYSPDAGVDDLSAAVLNRDGTVQSGPWPLATPASVKEQEDAETVWTGSTYLFARVAHRCRPDDLLCQPDSVMVTRVATGAGAPHLEVAAAIKLQAAPGACCASLAAFAGQAWLAWYEVADSKANTYNVRLVPLAPDGSPRGQPVTAATGPIVGLVRLAASREGLFLAWQEEENSDTRAFWRQFDHSGQALGPATLLGQTTSVHAIATIDDPPGVLFAWTARRAPSDNLAFWLARVECARP